MLIRELLESGFGLFLACVALLRPRGDDLRNPGNGEASSNLKLVTSRVGKLTVDSRWEHSSNAGRMIPNIADAIKALGPDKVDLGVGTPLPKPRLAPENN